jgi:hypothetical protein
MPSTASRAVNIVCGLEERLHSIEQSSQIGDEIRAFHRRVQSRRAK